MTFSLLFTRVDSIICSFLFLLLFYLLLTMLVRILTGEHVRLLKSPQFWFYLSTWMLVTIFCIYYAQEQSYCSIICYSYWPIHALSKLSLIFFMYSHLDLHNPEAVLGTKVRISSLCRQFIYICLVFFTISAVAKSVTRFWDMCWQIDQIGGCIIGQNPIYFLGNMENIVATIVESIICFQFVRASLLLCFDPDFQAVSSDWEHELLSNMWYYSITSVVMTITNIAFYVFCAFAHITGKTRGRDNPESQNLFQIYLYLNAANICVNVSMVLLCFPASSHNIFHLLSIHNSSKESFSGGSEIVEEDNSSMSAEELEAWKDFEESTRRIEALPIGWRVVPRGPTEESSSECEDDSSTYGVPLVLNRETGEIHLAIVSNMESTSLLIFNNEPIE